MKRWIIIGRQFYENSRRYFMFHVPKTRWELAIVVITIMLIMVPAFLYFIYFPVKNYTKYHPMTTISTGSAYLDSLFWESVYLKNEVDLSTQDSCYLVLNLRDNTMNLYMKGVLLKRASLEYIKNKGCFIKLYPDSLRLTAFTMESNISSIVKHPIAVRKAPKDVAEADIINKQPLSLPIEEVYYTMNFDKSLIVEISQTEKPDSYSTMHKRYFRRRNLESWQNFKSTVLKLEVPELRFKLKISMRKEDARAIYRALPEQVKLIVKY